MQGDLRKGLFLPLLAAALAFSGFLRTTGSENVRAVQIVSLLVAGVGLGIAIAHLEILWGLRSRK